MSKVDEVLENISSMTVLELSELLTNFEEKFGVTAAAPVAVAAAPAGGDAGDAAGEADAGGGTVDVTIADAGSEKIKVIKEVRGLVSLGLKEAKDLVDSAPAKLLEGVSPEEANKAKEALEAVGAKVEIG